MITTKKRRWSLKSTIAFVLAGVMLIGEAAGVGAAGASTVQAAEESTGTVITSMGYYSAADGPVIVREGVKDVSYGFVMPTFNGGTATWADVVGDLHVKVMVDGVYKNIDDVPSFQYNSNWGHWHDGGADGYWFMVSETTYIQLYSKANENITLDYTLQLNKLAEYELTSVTAKTASKTASVTGGSGIDRGDDLLYNNNGGIKFSQIEEAFNEDVEIQVKRDSEEEFVPLFDNAAAGWVYDYNFGVYAEGNTGWWFNNLEESITVRFHSKSGAFADADIRIIYTEPVRNNYTISAVDGITTFYATDAQANPNHEGGIYPGLPMVGGTLAVKSDLEKFVYEVYDEEEWKPMGDVWLYRENGYSSLSAKTQWGYSITNRYELWIRPIKEDAQVRIGYPANGQVGGDIGDNYVYYTFVGDPAAVIPDVSDMGNIEIDNTHTEGDVNSVTAPEGWNLIWNDEFNGTSLNEANWANQTGYLLDENDISTYGWGNKELEFYTDSPNNTSVANGKLNLTLLKESKTFYEADDPTQSITAKYSSGKVLSQNKFAVKYGRVDFRAKLPDGVGIWPALWMMPNRDTYGTWARSGEIDVMEGRGRTPDTAFGTLHYGDVWPNDDEDGLTMTMSEYGLTDMTDWHVYSVVWEEDNIKIYCDGICYYKGTNETWFSAGDYSNNNAPFDQQFYIILNLAAGGYFDGLREPEESVTRKDMYVDYVRVYQKTAEEGDPDDDGDGLYGDYLIAVKVPLEKMSLDKTSISIPAGYSETITPSFEPSNATNKNITWTSSNESVATVLGGKVTGIKPGTTTITAVAEDGGITKTCSVTVTGDEVTAIAVNPTTLELTEGETGALTATVTGTNQNVIWSSSATDIATVDQNGNVTAKAEGTATITVTSVADNTKTATCTVTVNAKPPVEVTGVTIKNGTDESGEVILEEGDSVTLSATITPSDATDKRVTWDSEDDDVATVTENGKVTAVAAGTTTITVTTTNGTSDTWNVIVKEKVISTERTDYGVERVGNDVILYYNNPAQVAYSTILNSADETIVENIVPGYTNIVEKDGYYEYTISDIVAGNEDKYLACWFNQTYQNKIVIKISDIPVIGGNEEEEPPVTIPIDSVSITNAPSELKVGDTLTLRASVLPLDATEDRSVIWSSNNPNAVTVDAATGRIEAVGAGTATITVKSVAHDTITADCTITVKNTYTVTFKDGDNTLSTQIVEANGTAIKPSNPTKTGYTFVGWLKDGSAFDFDTAITANTTLIAEWSALKVNRIQMPSVITLQTGITTAIAPTVTPSNAADTSLTWSSEDADIASVDATTGRITAVAEGETTIKATANDGSGVFATCTVEVVEAVIDKALYQVDFNINGSVTFVKVEEGEKVEKPADPEIEGYVFEGWFDKSTGEEFDFDTPITKRTILVAKLTKHVTGVSLNKSAVTLIEGSSETLTATVSPTDATDKSVTWTSSKPDVATVDSNGKVTAKTAGTTTITVKTKDGNYAATCTVTVTAKQVAVSGVTLNKSELTLVEGSSETLTATVAPETASNKAVTWASTKSSVAEVDASGKVTAKSAGEAFIAVTTVDGSYTATCKVTVKAKESGSTNPPGSTETKEYKVTFDSAEGTVIEAQTVKNGEKATKPVDPTRSGYKFMGWYAGETAYNFDSAVSADITLTAKWEVIKITKVKVTAISNKIAAGKSVQLKATLSPTDAVAKSVTWKLAKKSDSKYAKVSSKGKVTLKKKGAGKKVKVKATVTGLDGTKKTKTFTISIKKHAVKKLTIKGKKTLTVKRGKSVSLKSKVKITTTGKSVNKTLKWTTSDKTIATVSKSGKVKVNKNAKKGKKVKIKAQSTDGTNKKVTFTIKVK